MTGPTVGSVPTSPCCCRAGRPRPSSRAPVAGLQVICQQAEGAVAGKGTDNAKVPVVKGSDDIGTEFAGQNDIHRVG
jgi:hypothetical protein